MPDTGEVTPISKEGDFEWKMNFASFSNERRSLYYSPNFSFEGESWYLEIWPNGYESRNTVGYIDLGLHKCDSENHPINMELCFSLKSVNGQKTFIKQITGVFTGKNYHDIKRFLSKTDFEKRQSEFLASGFLTVVCTLKKLNSMEHAYDRPLCEDFKKVLLSGLNHDLILKVGDKELRAHQDIMRARSQVFESMLSHDTKEKKSGIIEIPDCDPDAMEQFLCYIYTGKVDSLEESNMLKLYYIADKYDMKGLKGKCCAFMKESLSITNICDVIQLALIHTDSILLEFATEYFIDNVVDIMCTVEWQTFMKDNTTVANELTIKSFKKLKEAKF